MNEIIKLLEDGNFVQERFCAVLPSGASIWTANGLGFYNFYPNGGKTFTLWEQIRIARAIKKGRIKQAIKPRTPNDT